MFTNVVKPTHACNLACTYCYNEDERNKKMTLDTLRAVVDRTCEFVAENVKDRKVDFIWHGGEPMLMGVDFYREVMSYQSLHSHKIHISNVMQTNGLKVNEEWCEFFKEHNWQVSISLDGTKSHTILLAYIETEKAHSILFMMLFSWSKSTKFLWVLAWYCLRIMSIT